MHLFDTIWIWMNTNSYLTNELSWHGIAYKNKLRHVIFQCFFFICLLWFFLHKTCGKCKHLQTHHRFISFNITLLIRQQQLRKYLMFKEYGSCDPDTFTCTVSKIIQIIFNQSTHMNFFRRKYIFYLKRVYSILALLGSSNM